MLNLKQLLKSSKQVVGIKHNHPKPAALAALSSMPRPKQVLIPLYSHGVVLSTDLKIGDTVKMGQCIGYFMGDAQNVPPVHASVSGQVVDIRTGFIPHTDDMQVPLVVIENDGQNDCDFYEPLKLQDDPKVLIERIFKAGIVGMGGGGFPSARKINAGHSMSILLVNGAECEPEISCDDVLMRNYAFDVLQGAQVVMHILSLKSCLVGIEDNKKIAFDQMRAEAKDKQDFDVMMLPTVYPGGSEKQLIQSLTGMELPEGKRPADLGIVCFNVGTLKAIYDAVFLGKPLLERVVTLSGEGVQTPQNLWAPLGSSFADVFNYVGKNEGNYQVIMGGPMMGILINGAHDLMSMPVLKVTNCILRTHLSSEPVSPCIRCGECARVCPMHLLPQQLYWFSKSDKFDRLSNYNLFDCIECGACAYVCPSKIPLVNYYRYAKESIRLESQASEKSDIARKRHQNRQSRLECQENEHKEKLAKRRAQMKKSKQDHDVIQKTLERVQKTKEEVEIVEQHENK